MSDDLISLGGESAAEDNAELMSNEQIQRITSLVQQQIRLEEETSEQAKLEVEDLALEEDEQPESRSHHQPKELPTHPPVNRGAETRAGPPIPAKAAAAVPQASNDGTLLPPMFDGIDLDDDDDDNAFGLASSSSTL